MECVVEETVGDVAGDVCNRDVKAESTQSKRQGDLMQGLSNWGPQGQIFSHGGTSTLGKRTGTNAA